MGALAPAQLWIPEDDALLKNAVETGASLESLAKGAVRFSRRFTFQELCDRWESLLFDKGTSENASSHILEVESDNGFSVSNHPKLNRPFGCKGLEPESAKRNFESLRCHYNAIRKRVCNGPSNYQRFDFDMPTANCLSVENGHCDGQLRPSEQLFEYCIPENQIHVDYDIQEAGDAKHGASFPDMLGIDHDSMDVDDPMESLKGRFEDDVFCGDNLYEHVDAALPMHQEKVATGNVDQSYENLTDNKDVPCMFKESFGTFLNCSGVGSPQGLGNDIETKPFPVSDPINCNHNSTICSSFDKNLEIKTEFMDCGNSFHQEQYSSPIPEMPIWDTIDGISSPIMNIIGGLEEKDNDSGTPLNLPNEIVEKTEPPDGNNIPMATNFPQHNNAVQQQDDLTSIPLSFTNDGEIFFACMDRSCFESINNFLMNSPNDVHRDDNANSSEPKTRVLDECNQIEQAASVVESKDVDAEVDSIQDNGNTDFGSTHTVPDVSQDIASSSKLLQRFDCCVLNMEDTEIPCNDGIILDRSIVSTFFPINARSSSKETSLGPSCKIILDEGNSTLLNIPRENQETSTHHFESRPVITQTGDGSHASQIPCLSIAGACKQELEMASSAQMNIPFQEKLDPVDMEFPEPQQIASTSDQEMKYSDSDQDAPCFSDIEALILDMELDSDDQESLIYTSEVSRCQRFDTRKAIIRLEQGASSYVQRAISYHGAFAVFYGRYLKHYIKKSKVLLGRATRESEVDIDLTKEALTNKISRHQAIIELDDNGLFFIKNMGKCSMFINGKEVSRGKCCKLSSRCLIEIRSMVFTFEVNLDYLRKYLSSLPKKKTQAWSSNFDWSPKS